MLRKLKITLKIEETQDKAKLNTLVIPYIFETPILFKTTDSVGEIKFFNRTRAIALLIFYLIDKKFISIIELFKIITKYDLSNKKRETFLQDLEVIEKEGSVYYAYKHK